MIIREARPADAAEITEVFLTSRRAGLPYLPENHTDAETLGFITNIVLVQDRVWAAIANDEILGFAALHSTWLDHLYIRPDRRGQGIGTALLEAVRNAGPDELKLYVFQRNTRAQQFYRNHGFVEIAATDGSGNEELEPDFTYRWARDTPG